MKLFYQVIFLCFFSFTAQAASLTELLNSIQTMRANFTQTTYDNHGKAVQQSYGRMALQRPGKFRWEVTKPIPQLIVANGTKLWIYDQDLEQVTIRPLKKAVGDAPALLLSNVGSELNQNYIVKEVPKKSPSEHWFVLTSRKTDEMFLSVQMGFVNNQISEMDLQDNLGHTTVIRYKDIQTNTALAAATFNFKPPAGVDVIDETRR